ncbi:hypothetical protein Tco_0885689 [Tanacetum coccineum]
MSMIGVLTYFLKFQIKKPKRGISINKEKDVNDLLRMYDKIGSSVNTPIIPPNMLGPDLNSKVVNESQYSGIIGPLMNLAASRPNIQFSTAYARHQANMRNPTLFLLRIFSANKQQSEAMFSTDAEDIAAAGCYAIILWIKKPFTKSPNMYKEYLAEFWYSAKALENSKVSFSIPTGGIFGQVGVNTFRNAIGTHYLPHSSEYVAPPSINVVRQWFPTIGYGEEVSAKGTLRKSLLPPSKEATKGGSSKVPTGFKTGHSKKRKEASIAWTSNPTSSLVSTPVDTGMHKEDQQATGGPTSLGVTSEARANPQLSSGMSAFNLNEPIYSTSFIIHSETASGNVASAVSIAEADSGKYAPSIDPYVLADKTQSVSEGLEIVLTQPTTGKGASSIARWVEEDEASRTIKLEDLAKMMSSVQLSFKDLDSLEDDHIIVVDHSNCNIREFSDV